MITSGHSSKQQRHFPDTGKRRRAFAIPVRQVLLALMGATAIVSLYIALHEHRAQQHVQQDIHSLKSRYALLSHHVDSLQILVSSIDQRVDFINQLAFGDMTTREVLPARERIRDLSAVKGTEDTDVLSMLSVNVHLLQRKVDRDSITQHDILDLAKSRQMLYAAVPGIRPLAVHPLTALASGYGLRMHPFYHMIKMHQGIDFSAPEGTPVYATADGEIVAADTAFIGYGTLVIVDHGQGYQTRYAHLAKLLVTPGEHIVRGQVIATVGNTGLSTAPHLHYEVLLQGVQINPIHFLFRDRKPDDYANLVSLASLQNECMGN